MLVSEGILNVKNVKRKRQCRGQRELDYHERKKERKKEDLRMISASLWGLLNEKLNAATDLLFAQRVRGSLFTKADTCANISAHTGTNIATAKQYSL